MVAFSLFFPLSVFILFSGSQALAMASEGFELRWGRKKRIVYTKNPGDNAEERSALHETAEVTGAGLEIRESGAPAPMDGEGTSEGNPTNGRPNRRLQVLERGIHGERIKATIEEDVEEDAPTNGKRRALGPGPNVSGQYAFLLFLIQS